MMRWTRILKKYKAKLVLYQLLILGLLCAFLYIRILYVYLVQIKYSIKKFDKFIQLTKPIIYKNFKSISFTMFPSFIFHPRLFFYHCLFSVEHKGSYFCYISLFLYFFCNLPINVLNWKQSKEKKRKIRRERRMTISLAKFLYHLKWWHRHEQFHGIDVFLTIVNLWMIPRQLTVSSSSSFYYSAHTHLVVGFLQATESIERFGLWKFSI